MSNPADVTYENGTTEEWWKDRTQDNAILPTPQTAEGSCIQVASPGFYPYIVSPAKKLN